ncbi:hypothetical protein PM8797T_29343 [Gimesia maris DSM 8797]|nr:hypothetical protein PM8797T_29343 [Gimesia maris DSM 8797]
MGMTLQLVHLSKVNQLMFISGFETENNSFSAGRRRQIVSTSELTTFESILSSTNSDRIKKYPRFRNLNQGETQMASWPANAFSAENQSA